MTEDEKLLEEYRLAQEYTLSVNDHTWQVATILLVASLGGFAIVSSFEKITKLTFFASLGAAGISVTLLLVWFFMMERHTLFIQTSYFRMREIERQLGLKKNLYIHYIDNIDQLKDADLSKTEKEHIREIRKSIFDSNTPKIRSRTLLKILLFSVILIWTAWIIFQISVIWFGIKI